MRSCCALFPFTQYSYRWGETPAEFTAPTLGGDQPSRWYSSATTTTWAESALPGLLVRWLHLKLLRLIILRPPRVDFTPLGSLPAFCVLPLVELPAVAGMHPGRPCVSPARHLTGVAASDLPRLSRGPEPIHNSLSLYCRWTRSEWQWFPVVLLGPQKKKGPGVSACRHAHTSGNRSGTHYVLLLSEGALTCQRSLFPSLWFYCSLKGH